MMIRIRIVKKSKITNKILVGRLNHYVHQLVKIKQMHDCRINSKTLMKHRNNYLQMFRMIVSINRIVKQI